MATTIVGLFDNREAAQQAAQALQQQGISRSDIDISTQAATDSSASTTSTTTGSTESGWDKFLDALHLRAPEEDTNFYRSGVRADQFLLSATTQDDASADTAADILQRYGAADIDEHMAQYRSTTGATTGATAAGYATSGTTASTGYATGDTSRGYAPTGATSAATGATSGETVIPVVEEELQVGKRSVQRGGVRIYRHVTERPVEEQVTLHEEHVNVDRRPVNRAVTDADNAFQGGTMELTETAEEAVVSKNARVVEEIVVGKTATDRTETVRDTVRRTDVDVQEIDTDAVTTRGTDVTR